MSHWGDGLLAAFVALGISAVGWRKAGRLAWLVAVFGMVYAFHTYHAI